jgi:AraC-like DNA-binding protein
MPVFDLKAEDIARDLGMSRTHFFRQVKQETGKTPSQFLQDARFERARHLLETGGVDSVKAAALSVGFRNGKYFSRVFRERYGKWPSECLK